LHGKNRLLRVRLQLTHCVITQSKSFVSEARYR
jgi:hypothetical protein